jgi:GNAT superfamily N-acetyltransferase
MNLDIRKKEIKFRRYESELGFTSEFEMIRKMLIEANSNKMTNTNFLWARWEWAISLMYMMDGSLEHNGLWFHGDKLVAFATNEVSLGKASFIILPGYEFLKDDMFTYAMKAFPKDGNFKVCIADNNFIMQKIARNNGFIASQEAEKTSAIDISDDLTYRLPEGFQIHSLSEGYDIFKLNRCTYRGFENGDEPDYKELSEIYQGPNFNKTHHIYVQAPNGDYASYCGTWYDKETDYAYIEPVCTDPRYRKKGCAKAAVYETIKRCGKLGAKRAYVISSQQFYYNIGFYPVETYTWWYAVIQ